MKLYIWSFKVRFDSGSSATVEVVAGKHGDAWLLVAAHITLYNHPPESVKLYRKVPLEPKELEHCSTTS